MESMENKKMDLFQSLKDEMLDSSEEGPSTSFKAPKLPNIKNEDDNLDDDFDNLDAFLTPGTTANVFDKAFKKKIDKQHRKELEEEEREKML